MAGYRQTICRIKPKAYLLRRINAVEEPIIARARETRSAMVAVTVEMIANLHWADFETLVDLIFARSGWQRVSRVGDDLVDVDLILEQPATGEKAFVQVKSKAGQAVLDDYVDRFRRSGAYDRMFFVYHSPKGTLSTDGEAKLHVWAGDRLADPRRPLQPLRSLGVVPGGDRADRFPRRPVLGTAFGVAPWRKFGHNR